MPITRLQDKEEKFAEAYALSYPKEVLLKVREKLSPNGADEEIALWIVAPCLTAFALWVKNEIAKHEDPLLIGVMREGRFLLRLMKSLFNIDGTELWANRSLSQRAAFGNGDQEALINWLIRTPMLPLPLNEAAQILTGETNKSLSENLLNAQSVHDLLADPIFMKSAELYNEKLAARFLKHLEETHITEKRPILLLDFASVGNIQRALHKILLSQGYEDSTFGLNFAMTEGAKWARKAGVTMTGFACDDGHPAFFTRAIARTPELMEVFTSNDLGSLEDFTEDGKPLLSKSFLSAQQISWLDKTQEKILSAAKLYLDEAPDLLTPQLVHVLWGRLLLEPLTEEAEALGDWPLDGALDGKQARTLAPKRNEMKKDKMEEWSKLETAWPAATAVRA